MLIFTLTPSHISYSPPSQSGAWNTSLFLRFSYSQSASLSTLALSQPLPPSPPWWYAIVSFPLVVYSLWRSTYWVVKHSVRDIHWSFRWLYLFIYYITSTSNHMNTIRKCSKYRLTMVHELFSMFDFSCFLSYHYFLLFFVPVFINAQLQAHFFSWQGLQSFHPNKKDRNEIHVVQMCISHQSSVTAPLCFSHPPHLTMLVEISAPTATTKVKSRRSGLMQLKSCKWTIRYRYLRR